MKPALGSPLAIGLGTLMWAAAFLMACDDGEPIYGVGGGSGAPTDVELEVLSGDGQNGRTSEALPEPLLVRATRGGGAATGVTIGWAITKGAATLSSATTATDDSGRASVTVTPGPLLGEIEVTATVAGEGGDSVEFGIRTTVVLIDILINRFEVPLGGDSVEVVLGDTVEWVNRDALRHSVVSRSIPAGAPTFISGSLRNSERFRYVPKVEGLYDYSDTLSVQAVAPIGKISVVGREVGALRIETATTGGDGGAGFVVTVDGQLSSAVGPDDIVVFPTLSATAHLVRFVDPLERCAPAGENPRSVTVIARDTVSTRFDLACQ